MKNFSLFAISVLYFFQSYLGDEKISLYFSPHSFYPWIGSSKTLSLKKMKDCFDTSGQGFMFRKYLSVDLYKVIQCAAIDSIAVSPDERRKNETKISKLKNSKRVIEKAFPRLLGCAEENRESVNPFIEKPGLANTLITGIIEHPSLKTVIHEGINVLQKYDASFGNNFKLMTQEFTMHNLLFKVTLGGSIIGFIILAVKDIINKDIDRLKLFKVILFLSLANFFIFHWRKVYYGFEYTRHYLKEKEKTKYLIEYLKTHQKKMVYLLIAVEVSAVLFFLYKMVVDKNELFEKLKTGEYPLFASVINKNKIHFWALFLKLHFFEIIQEKLKLLMYLGLCGIVYNQAKIIEYSIQFLQFIEESLISKFEIDAGKKDIYEKVGGNFFVFLESVLYSENPQIAEDDFSNLATKIKNTIGEEKDNLSKAESTDVSIKQELEGIRKQFELVVIDNVTSYEIKSYDFKNGIADFILVQKVLLLAKICFMKGLFEIKETREECMIKGESYLIKKNPGVTLKNNNGPDLSEQELLKSIGEYCQKLASKNNEEDTRKTLSQIVISLFNLIKKSVEIGRFEKDDFWYVEELVDQDFEKLYPECYDHINGAGTKTFWDTCKEVFSGENILKGLKDDKATIVKTIYLPLHDRIVTKVKTIYLAWHDRIVTKRIKRKN